MNAKEARQKAHQTNTSNSEGRYFEVIKMIKNAAAKGYYELFVYNPINDDVRNKLKEMGYSVSQNLTDRNETFVKITW